MLEGGSLICLIRLSNILSIVRKAVSNTNKSGLIIVIMIIILVILIVYILSKNNNN